MAGRRPNRRRHRQRFHLRGRGPGACRRAPPRISRRLSRPRRERLLQPPPGAALDQSYTRGMKTAISLTTNLLWAEAQRNVLLLELLGEDSNLEPCG